MDCEIKKCRIVCVGTRRQCKQNIMGLRPSKNRYSYDDEDADNEVYADNSGTRPAKDDIALFLKAKAHARSWWPWILRVTILTLFYGFAFYVTNMVIATSRTTGVLFFETLAVGLAFLGVHFITSMLSNELNMTGDVGHALLNLFAEDTVASPITNKFTFGYKIAYFLTQVVGSGAAMFVAWGLYALTDIDALLSTNAYVLIPATYSLWRIMVTHAIMKLIVYFFTWYSYSEDNNGDNYQYLHFVQLAMVLGHYGVTGAVDVPWRALVQGFVSWDFFPVGAHSLWSVFGYTLAGEAIAAAVAWLAIAFIVGHVHRDTDVNAVVDIIPMEQKLISEPVKKTHQVRGRSAGPRV